MIPHGKHSHFSHGIKELSGWVYLHLNKRTKIDRDTDKNCQIIPLQHPHPPSKKNEKFPKKKRNIIKHGNNGGIIPTSCASTNSDRGSSTATTHPNGRVLQIHFCKKNISQSLNNLRVIKELKPCHCRNYQKGK